VSTPLLATKLQMPRVPASVVSRPRLTDKLLAGLREGRRLTVLSAPAGYGKTTLLVEWLTLSDRLCGWLSLDERDNEAVRFWMYTIAALQRSVPGLGELAMAALQAPQPPAFEPLLTGLINEIAERSESLLLVVDDYHLITSPRIHEALSFLVENLPRQLHLVIATRSDPALPLATLRARGQLTELRLAELRFSAQETSAFLGETMGLRLSPEAVERLEARTEGWIAGLQLAALSMQGRDDLASFVESFTGSHRYILDYLAEEVLNRQTQRVREFLLQTSILQRLNGPLCDAVTGRSDGQQMLEWLEGANLFVLPLDDERKWYRYHRLFADLLRARLEDGEAGTVAELHRRASLWYEEHHAIHDAFSHAVDAGDVQRMRQLFETNGMPLLMHGELGTLLTWVSQLPVEVVANSARIGTLHAWALLLTGQMQPLEKRLLQLESVLEQTVADDVAGQIAAIRAYQAAQVGDVDGSIGLAQSALRLLSEGNEEIRSVVLFTLGGAHLLQGSVAAAGQAMADASAMATGAGNIHLAVPALNSLAAFQLLQGRLEQSEQTARQAIELATLPSGQLLPVASGALSSLADLAYERDELEEALSHARESTTLGERWGNKDALISGYLTVAQVLQGMGSFGEAEESIGHAERLSRSVVTNPMVSSSLRATRCRQWLALGRRAAVERWAAATAPEPVHPMRVAELLALARVQLTLARVDAAAEVLGPLVAMARAQSLVAVLVEALALQAQANATSGKEPMALEMLGEALQLGEAGGLFRRFVDLGPPLAALLRLAARHGISVQYVARLLAAFARREEPGPGPAAPAQPLLDPLSDRELEVLGLVAQGLSNREIAERLFVTVSTVKSHTNHIFGKLNTRSRTEAVAKARELGLL